MTTCGWAEPQELGLSEVRAFECPSLIGSSVGRAFTSLLSIQQDYGLLFRRFVSVRVIAANGVEVLNAGMSSSVAF